jgi:hypothetical protein
MISVAWLLSMLVLVVTTTAQIQVKFTAFGALCMEQGSACGYQVLPSGGHATEIMIERLNAVNYIPGHTIVLDAVDTTCSGGVGSTAAANLILQDKSNWPFGVLGCSCSGCTMGSAKIPNQTQSV